MLTALLGGARIRATPGLPHAACPICSEPVRTKCGKIVVWHWAHLSGGDCDEWAEADTVWHRDWQDRFPIDRVEVAMGRHRADAVAATGNVIEFQHSSLSVDDIRDRELFYGPKMVWVFDTVAAYEQDRFLPRYQRARGIWTFRWKHARKSIRACRRMVFLDLGDGRMFDLRRIYADEAPVGGWGQMVKTSDFLKIVVGDGPAADP